MIELTPEQARAVAQLTERQGTIWLHQLAHTEALAPDDVYVTPQGESHGYRIARDGTLTEIGETLPAPG